MSSHGNDSYFISKFSETSVGSDLVSRFTIGSNQITIARPQDIDRLIDSPEVSSNFQNQHYMPYWANIWPVSFTLAERILSKPLPNLGACLELGCGLGLAGIAALVCGYHVTFSDYDENALVYAMKNVGLNHLGSAEFLKLNWKYPIDRTFDFIVGADLTWDLELVPHIVNVFDLMLKPDGVVWLADQNRLDIPEFSRLLHEKNLTFKSEPFDIDPKLGWDLAGAFYEIKRGRK